MLSRLFKKSNNTKDKEKGYYIYVVTTKENQTYIFYSKKRHTKEKGLQIIHDDCKKNDCKLQELYFEETIEQRNRILDTISLDYK